MTVRLAEGTLVAGRYRLDRLLGQGGMGAVWAATHTITRRHVALKFLKGPAQARPELRRRFLREARAACLVEHPNVVVIHDVFEEDDETPVMVMDLLEGETLGARLAREGALSLEEAALLLLPVVSAVGTAHARGIVHRDLKPDNIFLVAKEAEKNRVKVLDFGIAKLLAPDDRTGTADVATDTGVVLGTPCYMAPEQSFGEKDIDHRADVWALGAILYELLSGRRPLDGDNLGQVLKQLVNKGIEPLASLAPELPDDITALVERMLARNRDDRPADLREVAEVLGKHTEVKVPSFGAPGQQTPLGDDDELERVVVHLETTDPEGATREAATPLDTAAPQALSVPKANNRRLAVVGVTFAAAAVVVLVVLVSSQNRSSAAATSSGTSAASASVASPTATVASAPSDTAVSVAPAAPASTSSAGNSGSATPSTSAAPTVSAAPPHVAKAERAIHRHVASRAKHSAAAHTVAPAPTHSAPPPAPAKPKGGLVNTAPF